MADLKITQLTEETSIQDAHEMYQNSAGSDRKITWTRIKAFLKTYFDSIYSATAHTHATLHTQGTDAGTTGADFTVDSDSATGKIKIAAAAGASDKTLTLTNTALTDNRTITLPDSTGTLALVGAAPTAHAASHATGQSDALAATSIGAPSAADLQVYGFTDRAETTISFNDSTYIFTLASVGANWSYYRAGVKYTITGNKTLTLAGSPPSAGTNYIFIDDTDGDLSVDTNSWSLTSGTKVPVAILCWNNALTPKYCLADERHTCKILRNDHAKEHYTEGTVTQTVGALSGYAVAPASPADSDNDYAIGESVIWDEDIQHTIAQVTGGSTYHIEYRTAAAAWAWVEQAVPFRYTTSGYIQWDNAGTMTEAGANKYINTYLAATNGNANSRYIIIHGQTEHSTLAAAQAAKFGGLTLTGLQFHEVVALYQITWQTSNSYTTTGKCRIAATPVLITTSLVQAPAAPGLGTMSTQNANNVNITGGVISVPEIEIADPSADHTAVGIISPNETFGEEVTAFGTPLYRKSDGKLWKTDADAATTMPCCALSLNTATVAADGTSDVLLYGKARDDSWNWTVGDLVFIGTNAGELVASASAPSGTGDQLQKVGQAYHADKLFFSPSLNVAEVA